MGGAGVVASGEAGEGSEEMRVKVKLNNCESGGLESDFDTVEFSSIDAEDVHGWIDAVRTFVNIGRRIASAERILAESLFVDGGWCVKDWDEIVELLGEESKAKLIAALEKSAIIEELESRTPGATP